MFLGQFLTLLYGYLSLWKFIESIWFVISSLCCLELIDVWFIAHQEHCYILIRIHFSLSYPMINCIKGLHICDWVYDKNTHTSFIVSLCNSFKSLLTSCIPYLQSYSFIINIDCFYFEIDANGGHMCSIETIFAIPQHDISFANTTVADHKYLSKMIIILFSIHWCASTRMSNGLSFDIIY